jgi:hypothetical protein
MIRITAVTDKGYSSIARRADARDEADTLISSDLRDGLADEATGFRQQNHRAPT